MAYRTKAKELDHILIAKQVVAVSPLGTPLRVRTRRLRQDARAGGRRLRRNVLRRAPPHGPHRVNTAADHCEYFAALPSEIKGMFLIRARRGLGLTAHRGWARLLIDRMDTQVQRPEFPQDPELAWGSTNASVQDDRAMDAHHYYHPLRLQC